MVGNYEILQIQFLCGYQNCSVFFYNVYSFSMEPREFQYLLSSMAWYYTIGIYKWHSCGSNPNERQILKKCETFSIDMLFACGLWD